MHCEELTDDVLLDCAERRVRGPALEAIEGHLTNCRLCTERYIDTAHIHELAGVALKVAPSAAVDARILQELEELFEGRAPRKIRRWLVPALAAAAAVAFAFLSTLAVTRIQPAPIKHAMLCGFDPSDLVTRPPEPVPTAPVPDIVRIPVQAVAEDPVALAPAPAFPLVRVEVTPLIPDLNGDGKIDVADLMILLNTLNEESSVALYDLNGDGKVDVADKMLLLRLEQK